MNKIEKMIKELCTNGVEWKKLGDVCDIVSGKDYKHLQNGNIPVYGSGGIMTFVNKSAYDKPTVLLPRKGSISNVFYVNGPFWNVDTIYYTKIYEHIIDTKYLFYYLQREHIEKYCTSDAARPALTRECLSKIQIPLPPLPIQTEIVRILDKFVEQQEQLERLIELRKKQYEYYREEMLKPKEGEKWETVTIGELGTITRGRRFVRDDVRDSGMPCIHYGDMYTYYGITAKNTKTFLDRDFPKKMQYAKKGDVVVVGAGENDLDIGVGTVWDGEEPAAVHDACYILEHKQNPKYIAYFLRTNNYHQQLRKYVSDGKICSISSKGLGSCFIPIPSLTKQQEIVDFLDKFEQNLLDLKSALEQSKARYEYYRDQLLKF